MDLAEIFAISVFIGGCVVVIGGVALLFGSQDDCCRPTPIPVRVVHY